VYKVVGAGGQMADSSRMLSACDAIHLVVTKTSCCGDTTLVSSQFVDWRQVLTAAESRCRLSVELMGIGLYQCIT